MKNRSSHFIGMLGGCFAALLICAPTAAADANLHQTVAELKDSDPDTSRRARLELLRPENAANVAAHREEILNAITAIASEEDAVLLGLLELPSERKQMVLDSPQTPDKVRARLGDVEARARVIKRFESASSLVELRKSAVDLLYVKDATSLKAFGKKLESKDVFEDPFGNKVSAVALLIQTYGQAYPQEALFSTQTYMRHANVAPQEFRAEAHQSYLREIEKHLKERHQLEVHLDPPLLLSTEKIEVYRQKISP